MMSQDQEETILDLKPRTKSTTVLNRKVRTKKYTDRNADPDAYVVTKHLPLSLVSRS